MAGAGGAGGSAHLTSAISGLLSFPWNKLLSELSCCLEINRLHS